MRNKVTRVITAADLPADPKPHESLVAIERSKTKIILAALLQSTADCRPPQLELVGEIAKTLRQALEGPEMAIFVPWELDDRLTGNRVKIEVSPQYSELQINNRHYYFHRETGNFDGTGTDFVPMD